MARRRESVNNKLAFLLDTCKVLKKRPLTQIYTNPSRFFSLPPGPQTKNMLRSRGRFSRRGHLIIRRGIQFVPAAEIFLSSSTNIIPLLFAWLFSWGGLELQDPWVQTHSSAALIDIYTYKIVSALQEMYIIQQPFQCPFRPLVQLIYQCAAICLQLLAEGKSLGVRGVEEPKGKLLQ